MDDLESYVLTELTKDEEIIKDLDDNIETTIDLFAEIDFEPDSLWPYWIHDSEREDTRRIGNAPSRPNGGRLSQSTTAMIAAALHVATSYPSNRCASGYRWMDLAGGQPPVRTDKLDERLKAAVAGLAARWFAKKDPTGVSHLQPDHARTSSTTFGPNDILSLSWHLDLFAPEPSVRSIAPEAAATVYKEAERIVARRVREYAKAPSGYFALTQSYNDERSTQSRIILDSAYNLIRFVRCLSKITTASSPILTRTRDRAFYRIQSRLHDQLSFFSITDSRFDASELAFCLEGMLQLRPQSVNDILLGRVMQVMSNAQERSAYWASEMPIIADHKGHVLYPISVEIARSLLASISIFDFHNSHRRLDHSAGSDHLHLIQRYWQWLKTRRTTITIKQDGNIKHVSGWQSEHLNDAAVIHTWETSQILEFCIAFRDQMRRYVARKLLLTSRLNVIWPDIPGASWLDVVRKFEPVTTLGVENQIYKRLGDEFIKHQQDRVGTKPFWSMLIFGPPGTGKTALAKNIAGYLRIPLITITVSDFFAEGESRMENRAKLLFDVLTRQEAAVAFFDEWDQFILDRDSDLFQKQDSAFQFLTPGMLTKIASLREKENVIFIVATNYEERIDAAIKRPGRIDLQYLMLPPDGDQRLAILRQLLPALSAQIGIDALASVKLIAASAFLGYTDMKRIANEAWVDLDHFVERLAEAPRNVQFRSYADRFAPFGEKEVDLSTGPRDELLALFRLARDAWGRGTAPWMTVANQYPIGRSFSTAIIQGLLGKRAEENSKVDFVSDLETRFDITLNR